MPRVTFLGAAKTVTGSKYLVEFDNKKVLLDCGLFQGKKELRLRNWEQPKFEPKELDAIVLTHAHIDHTGYLPLVSKLGYNGPIYCSSATKELLSLLLPDSAHLQEEEAMYANKHGTSSHTPAKPLYSLRDAENVLKQLKVFPKNESTKITENCFIRPTMAGHVLGATSINMDVSGKRITFSGDVGRFVAPILPNPEPLDIGDLLICESTYGNRDHAPGSTKDDLARVIIKAIAKKGPIIIPAFALGRTQDLLYLLAELEREGKIPILPVYVDSPMAINATEIYRAHKADYDEEALAVLKQGNVALSTEKTFYCRTVDQSKHLNESTGTKIIISASGMVTGGRVLHHMMHWLPKEETTVIFVGYQAEETRGRIILSGAKDVKIFGSSIPIRAEVCEISGLSAHGDRNELLRWLKSCSGTPKFVKITHGEIDASTAFAELLKKNFSWKVEVADYLETVDI